MIGRRARAICGGIYGRFNNGPFSVRARKRNQHRVRFVIRSGNLLGAKQPSRQFVMPDQIGALAVFLCSDAAAQMTGVPLSIDGGWTAQ